MQRRFLFSVVLSAGLAGSASAQATWIVNAAGGAGVHFADLPSAVVAAAHGDTIIVQTGPFNEGATGFTTDKGLTIVGEGGAVPIYTSTASPIVIANLPVDRSFRMVGFSRPNSGELNFRVSDCAGQVHLERLQCREPGLFGPVWPAVEIYNSDSVTMTEFETFGLPCVQIDSSRVSLVRCRLGVSYIGLGGGPAIVANYSTVHISEPRFATGTSQFASIDALNSDLRVGGSVDSYIDNPGGYAILVNGGSLLIDPGVPINAGGAFGPVTGTGIQTYVSVPVTFAGRARPGQPVTISTAAEAASFVFPVLGLPGPLTTIPLGPLGIDVTQPFGFLPVTIVPSQGPAVTQLGVPASLPIGDAYAMQAVVFNSSGIELSMPVTFVLH